MKTHFPLNQHQMEGTMIWNKCKYLMLLLRYAAYMNGEIVFTAHKSYRTYRAESYFYGKSVEIALIQPHVYMLLCRQLRKNWGCALPTTTNIHKRIRSMERIRYTQIFYMKLNRFQLAARAEKAFSFFSSYIFNCDKIKRYIGKFRD